MGWLGTLVPAGVQKAFLWAGALALALLGGLLAGLRMGADREKVRRADLSNKQRNRADDAAARYRGDGSAAPSLQRGDF